LKILDADVEFANMRRKWLGVSYTCGDKATIKLNVRRLPGNDFIEEATRIMLTEYLCACVFYPNKIRRECTEKYGDDPESYPSDYKIGCIPGHVVELIKEELGGRLT